jgi:uncharacterized protein YbaR (Trm112 family)
VGILKTPSSGVVKLPFVIQTETEKVMINNNLLEILRCPACVREKDGLLKVYQESWLICQDCGRKYPIVEEIPVMLIEEGEKWVKVAESDLPVPPPPIK